MHQSRTALRGALVGTTAAIVAFGGVTLALAGTQAGVTEAQKPAKATTAQAGVVEGQASTTRATARATPAPAAARAKPVAQQAGISAATEVKKAKKEDNPDPRRERASEAATPEAPAVQQAPAPAPGLTIDLGGRAPVVPQAPIAPKQLHIG